MIGTLINERYRLDSELGRGGMGTIYRAHDTLLDRDVAVKVLSDTTLNTESRARLLREAQAAARLNHPNIVSVHDAGEAEPAVPFIVMELVQGEPLQVGHSLEQTLSIAGQVCAALEHAHAHGIIHRDLKPENILIASDGCAKLTDFGLARTVASRLTTEGAIVGTVFYIAPEQALGGEIDHRADLYALGVMLYELTTGQLPFTGDDLLAVISQHLQAPVVPPSTHNAEIPPALDALILRLLSKQPDDRPASAAEVRHSLEDLSRPKDIPAAYLPESPKISGLCPNNLPAQATPFIGRAVQLAAVRRELIRPEVRLLTLTGPGGTGKTRLGLQVAADLLDHFEDGVFFVALASVSDPTLVMPTIAQTLGVREAESGPFGPALRSSPVGQGGPLLEALKDYLRDKHILLVLDNFEQVTPASPVVSDLLATALRLEVLVTSRASLRVYGEHDYPVPPLVTPDLKELPHLEQLTQVEAVQLFVERARSVKPDFAITDQNGPAIAEICRHLDGLPLAIELAAARVRLLPPHKMLSQLGDRFRLLTGGARDLPARHQTLRGAIDWSYELLDDDERALFRRLAVFCCTCTLEAVEAVCNPLGDLDVLNELESLVDQSLLNPSDANGEPRFGMLESIREYALERLGASEGEEAEEIHRRHAAFYLALAEEAEPKLAGPEQLAWLKRGNRHEIASRLRALGNVTLRQRDYGRTEALYKEGLALARELGYKNGIAALLNSLGEMARFQGDYKRAAALYEESLTLFRELGGRVQIAMMLHNLGYVVLRQGDGRQAAALFEESLALYQALKRKHGVTECLIGMAGVAAAGGQPATARRAARLFGAAEELLEATGGGLAAADQAEHDRYVALTREQLDESAFGAAWAEGRAMTMEQAVAYALEGARM
jgi:non-specific serine/threonine protein kinase